MAKLSPKNQMYAAIAATVVVAVAAVFLGIVPVFEQAAGVREQIKAENVNLVTARATLARRQSAKAESAANEVELMKIANEIPDSPQLPSLIIELQDIANDAGVELAEIAPSGMEKPAGTAQNESAAYSILPIEVVVKGDWIDLISFLRGIDDLDRGVRVKSVTFAYSPAKKDQKAFVKADVSLEAYVMAAATASATPPSLPSNESSGSSNATGGSQ